jgi:opacity protein-like surface antigen
MTRKKFFCSCRIGFIMAGLLAATAAAYGQSDASAFGTGNSLWIGGEYTNLQAGFPINSTIRVSGIGVIGNYNWNHQFGLEMHARFLSFGSWHGETEQDYLVGPRYTLLHSNKWRPYADFKVGLVKIQYPFSMGSGNSFTMAPGGGLERRLNLKLSARAAYEYQILSNSPNFTNEPKFGIKPNGFSAGITYRIF